MKKTYINPIMNILTIETLKMIATSSIEFNGENNGAGGLNEGVASGDGLSRGTDWDDEY